MTPKEFFEFAKKNGADDENLLDVRSLRHALVDPYTA